ncbi:MAG: formate--tetrahydrofolate ligase [Bacteroidia bacterium]|nr:formate--tetrahydrofolate ligase [Bacteroidia bacterium]
MKSDYELAQEAPLRRIPAVAAEMGLPEDRLIPYGHYKAKIALHPPDAAKEAAARLILVTAITPNKAGIGKTTTSIGLADGLRRLGRRAVLALREPSLGPCFGMKGGAAGGGYSQVLPMDDINLHFTGDFHAITSANNTLAALLDNYRYFNPGKPEGVKQVLFQRCLDVNDRALRQVLTGLGGHGVPAESGFVITPASELMAVLCLASGPDDLRARIGRILLGFTYGGEPLSPDSLGVTGAIAALLKDALLPNLVQTMEGTPALIHGGPFANIAHGCNSVIATRTALQYGEYVVTEAGFAADLGAEKFFHIKCRAAGLQPALSVLTATLQALRLHGGSSEARMKQPDAQALRQGLRNLARHIRILQGFGQPVLVALNRFAGDPPEEIALLRAWCAEQGVAFAVNDAFAQGGAGAMELAQAVADACEAPAPPLQYAYELAEPVEDKISQIVRKVYGGEGAVLSKAAREALAAIRRLGLEHLPVCMAKTQYAFTDDPAVSGLDGGFTIRVDDLAVSRGAGFIVAICGEMMRMPGLPRRPQALSIDVSNGRITGLS